MKIEAKHRVKSSLCEGKVSHRKYDMIWRTTQMQLIKLFLFTVAHKIVSNAIKYIGLQFWNKKPAIRKASQRTHVHCFTVCQGRWSQQSTPNLKDCWWDYTHISPQKEQALCWACTHVAEADWVLYPGKSTSRTNSNTFRRNKVKRQKWGKSFLWENFVDAVDDELSEEEEEED